MERRYFKKLTVMLILGLMLTTSGNIFASELEPVVGGTLALPDENQDENQQEGVSFRASQGKKFIIPGGKGTLTANAWRSSYPTTSGNTYQWDYEVSAVYSGDRRVESIRTSWQGGASLRNSASISLGLTNSGITAGSGSSWQYINTPVKYYENIGGYTVSDYRSNLVIRPSVDYRNNTISLINTAKVKLAKDNKTYEITAGV